MCRPRELRLQNPGSTVNLNTMHAVLLAAGSGRRLLPNTVDKPKVLVELCGEPILIRMLKQLSHAGVSTATIVAGDRVQQVRLAVAKASLPIAITWVVNDSFASTNNSWSLAMADEELQRGTLLIEGDVVADDEVIRSVCRARSEACWFVRPFEAGMDGACLQADGSGRLCSVSIVRGGDPPPTSAWKSMGDAADLARLRRTPRIMA